MADKSPLNPLDVKSEDQKDSAFIHGIVKTETEGQEKILEAAPEIDLSLLQEVAPPKSILLLVLKIATASIAGLGFISAIFFTSQSTGWFDSLNLSNVSKDFSSSNLEIINLQTDLNFYKILSAKAYLDNFSYLGDTYMQKFEIKGSQTADSVEKKDAEEQMAQLRVDLRGKFLAARDKLSGSLAVPLVSQDLKTTTDADNETLFKEKLTAKLTSSSNDLKASEDPEAKRNYKNYLQSINLVANSALKTLLIGTDFDALSDDQLYKLIKNVNALVVNDMSVIQKIKEKRIKWSDIMNELELRTIAVDKYYSDNLYNQLGGIRYSSYDFESDSRKVMISGDTKLFNTTNFTMIADLIDQLNSSPFFKNAEMKSFNKSGATDTGYTASLKLALDLKLPKE
ncbi:hypothetical protein HZC20_00185 [Candidatus Peregrinibacteria bacterium]|nr:hypothetical protein [Candidatus Peregrinibacteria bacterium]